MAGVMLMTTLTEQWKKGKLLNGLYWVKYKNGFIDIEEYIAHSNGFCYDEKKLIEEVLDEVPNYDEFQNLKEYEKVITSYNMKPIDYDLSCRVVTRLINEKKEVRQENTKLKELLKECREILFIEEMVARRNPRYRDELRILIKRINQVLGEG